MSLLICPKCEVKEYVGVATRLTNMHFGDNGGGYGRIKQIGNCPRCNYMYAVLFHGYELESEFDNSYACSYIRGSYYRGLVDEYEKIKEAKLESKINELLISFNVELEDFQRISQRIMEE